MLEKKFFAILFLIFMFSFSALSINNTIPVISRDLDKINDSNSESGANTSTVLGVVKSDIGLIEGDISENMYRRYDWIQLYGTLNRLLGKKEINGFDYALDKKGAYNAINFWSEARDISFRTFAQRLVMLRDEVEKNGSHFTFLLFPHKMNEAWNCGYEGIPYNDFNDQADCLLEWLDFYGVDYIDFRETMKASGMSFEEMFYRTDHHWTGKASFVAFQELIKYMNDEYDAGLDESGFYTDEGNYRFDIIENSFLGSSGRDVGSSFSNLPLDDFSAVSPSFDNKYIWKSSANENGSSSLFCKNALSYTDIYQSDMYKYYLDGVNTRDYIQNLDNANGPRAFFIRDSYASPLITFMAPMFSEIDASWGKYTSDRFVKNDVLTNDYDYVFVAYYTEDLYDEFFKFYEDDVEEFKLDYAESQGYMEGDN